jgi:large subunit ribosomal protein L13
MANEITIDATGAALGRLATFAAKSALLGKQVRIINCDDVVITGKKHAVVEVYKVKIRRGGYSQKGPYIPRTVDRMVRRTIRGMLPWNITRGREAFKRIKCFNEAPKEFAGSEKIISLPKAKKPYMTMAELVELI